MHKNLQIFYYFLDGILIFILPSEISDQMFLLSPDTWNISKHPIWSLKTHLRLFLLRREILPSFASIFTSFVIMSRGLISSAPAPWWREEVGVKTEFCSRTIVSKLLIFCSILDKTSQLSLSSILNRTELLKTN